MPSRTLLDDEFDIEAFLAEQEEEETQGKKGQRQGLPLRQLTSVAGQFTGAGGGGGLASLAGQAGPPATPGAAVALPEPTSGADALAQSGRLPTRQGPSPASGTGGIDLDSIKNRLIESIMTPQEPATGERSATPQLGGVGKALALVPGYLEGVAQRQRLLKDKEALDLRKRQLQGQEATQKLQQLQLLEKIQGQRRLTEAGQALGGLQRHADLLDPQAKAELESTYLGKLAEAGEFEAIQQYRKFQQEQRVADEFAKASQDALEPAALGDTPSQTPAFPRGTLRPQQTAPAEPALRAGQAGVFQRMVRAEAERQGVDPDLADTVVALESNYNPRATSPKGAQGLGQLMPATAQRFGVQDAYDPQQNIRGAVAYLKFLQGRYPGRRDLQLAAYNAGEGAVDQYKGVPPFQETRAYVQKGTALLGQRGVIQAPQVDDAGQLPTYPSAARLSPGLQQAQQELQQRMQQRDRLEALMQRMTGLPGGEKYVTQVRQQLQLTEQQIGRLQKTLSPAENSVERYAADMFGKAAYELTPREIGAINQRIQQEKVDVSAAQQRLGTQAAGERQAQATEAAAQRQAQAVELAAEKARQTELGKHSAEREIREGETLLERVKEDRAKQYIDAQTGLPVKATTKWRAVEAGIDADRIVPLSNETYKRYEQLQGTAKGLLSRYKKALDKVYGPGGIYESLKPEDRIQAGIKGSIAAFTQSDPDLVALRRGIAGDLEKFSRAIGGAVGTGTEGDIERARKALVQAEGLPDSAAVAYRLYNRYVDAYNEAMQDIFEGKNPTFTDPRLKRFDVEAIEAIEAFQRSQQQRRP